MNTINCPDCGSIIDVNRATYDGVQLSVRAELSKEYAGKSDDLKKREDSLREVLAHNDAVIASQVNAGKRELQTQLEEQARNDQQDALTVLQNELNSKTEQVRELNRTKAEVEALKRANAEVSEAAELKAQKTISDTLAGEREKLMLFEAEKTAMKVSEKEHIINQLKEKITEMQVKVDQGSMQIQGEVQELAIEEYLAATFPLDDIGEIAKGARGADCIQTVNTQTKSNCGQIYYESKRAKNFMPAWVEKFKADMITRGASVGVLVTECLPNGMERMGMVQGVWVCTFSEFKALAVVLRDSIIRVDTALQSQVNRGEKKEMLYSYLTGGEFKMQVEAIVEGFVQLQTDLVKERRAMEGLWKKREKVIDKVLLNTNYLHSSVKGIAGSAVESVPLLELANDGQSPGEVD